MKSHVRSLAQSRSLVRVCLVTTALIAPHQAHAEDVPETASAVSALRIEEIVVTARKREERLRDVPDAISAFTAEAIEARGIASVTDVAHMVPNFSIVQTQQPGTESISIRGTGQVRNGEPPVAVVIDGVQLSSAYQITQDLYDIERIEVLKGPQGAVYGRNAIGGAINITTRKPSNAFEGSARIGYGTGDDFRAGVSLSGPVIADKLLFRVAGSYRDFDGDIDNQFLGKPVNGDKQKNVRAGLLLTPADTIEIDLRYAHLDQDAGAAWYSFVPPGGSINEPRDVVANIQGTARRKLDDASARIEIETGFATITTIAAYARTKADIHEDFDYFPQDFLSARQPLDQKSWSGELRLTSNGEGPFKWMAGGYYLDTRRKLDSEIYLDPDAGGVLVPFPIAAPTLFTATRATDHNKAYALFGQLSYRITPAVELSGALRYDVDDRHQRDRVTLDTFDKTFDSVQPKAQATWFFAEGQMAYLSVGKGFRSGGFNPNPRITRIYGSERNWNYEIGTKLGLLDNRVLVNAAAFYTDVRDRQVYSLDLVTAAQVIANPIGKARILGLEGDVTARIARGFDIEGSIGYLATRITRYDTAIYAGLPAAGDFSGNRLPQTPALSYAVAAQYSMEPAPDWRVIARAEVNGSGGDYYWDVDNRDKRKALTFVDARLTVGYQDFELVGFVSNLFKERYNLEYVSQTFSGAPFGSYALAAPGRRFGVEGRYKF